MGRLIVTGFGVVWASPTTALGIVAALVCHLAGLAFGTHPRWRIGNRALQLLNSPLNWQGRAFTLGNVQVYGTRCGPDACERSYCGEVVNIGRHEEAHSLQAQWLGPLFLAVWLAGRVIGGDGIGNPLEAAADRYALGLSRTGF